MVTKNTIFDEFIRRYPNTSYGDVSLNRNLVRDPRANTPLGDVAAATDAAFIPDYLSPGTTFDAIVFGVKRASSLSKQPLDSFDGIWKLLPAGEFDAALSFACKCWIVSDGGALCSMNNLLDCRRGNPTAIGMLPVFFGVGDGGAVPGIGDIIEVQLYHNGNRAGKFLHFKDGGAGAINIADLMILPVEEAVMAQFNDTPSQEMSVYDDSLQFVAECQAEGSMQFEPTSLRPSTQIASKIVGWEGYRQYVYDKSKQNQLRFLTAAQRYGGTFELQLKNHSGYISSYDEAAQAYIGLGHLITEEEKVPYEKYLKQDTTKGMYIPGIDPSPFSKFATIDLVKRDLEKLWKTISANINTKLTQNQCDALCSLAFNIGAEKFASSTLVQKLNEGDCTAAAQYFLEFHNAINSDGWSSPEANEMILRRRKAEARLFIEGAKTVRGPLDAAPYDPDAV